jgi:hypothetical protein
MTAFAEGTATDAIADLLSLLKKFKAMVEKLTRDDYVDFVERATETDATANINKFKADLKKNWTMGHQLEHSPLADVLTTVRTLMMEAQRICKQNIMPPATAATTTGKRKDKDTEKEKASAAAPASKKRPAEEPPAPPAAKKPTAAKKAKTTAAKTAKTTTAAAETTAGRVTNVAKKNGAGGVCYARGHGHCDWDGVGALKIHPDLRVPICQGCYRFYHKEPFTRDEDGIFEHCRCCADGGARMYMCDVCPQIFCDKCVLNLGGPRYVKSMHECDVWSCLMCAPPPELVAKQVKT